MDSDNEAFYVPAVVLPTRSTVSPAAGVAMYRTTSALTAPLGARLAHKLPPAALKRAFALLLLAVGLKMVAG